MKRFFKNLALGWILLLSVSMAFAQLSGSLDESVALVEWQFPIESPLELHPFQSQLLTDSCCLHLHPALAPNLSEINTGDSPDLLNKLTHHAQSLYWSYVAGRQRYNPPFQLNFSVVTPQAIETLIQAGVRIFSLSSAIPDTSWKEFEQVIRKYPQVFFILSIPHISGNSLAIEAMDEFPIRLVKENLPNLVLAGEIKAYSFHIEKHRSGIFLGSEENPFDIVNQPGGESHPRFYMLHTVSTAALGISTRGGTSIAAPHLAHLISLALADLKSKGQETSVEATLKHLQFIMNETVAVDKVAREAGRKIFYFTLDTVLANLGEPLKTEAVWNFGVAPLSNPKVF